ncbi:hypothetical protein Peur_014097 [Populus x canadensis]
MSAWLSVSHHACRLYFYHFLQQYFSFGEGYKAFLCTRLPLLISNMTSRTIFRCKVLLFAPYLLRARGQSRSIRTRHLDSASHLFCTSRCNLLVSLPRIARSKKFMKNFNFQTVTRVH